jgi:hypothetical protein
MEASYWSLDRKDEKVWKKLCCLQARTIDFAKFGRLYLRELGRKSDCFKSMGRAVNTYRS